MITVIYLVVGDGALEGDGAVGEGEAELVQLGPGGLLAAEEVEAAAGAQHEEHVGPLSGHEALHAPLLQHVPGELGARGGGQRPV